MERELYNVYCKMFNEAEQLTEKINKSLLANNATVYSVFVSVGKEETKEFFVDIEYNENGYNRLRGLITKEKLEKRFNLNPKINEEWLDEEWLDEE